MDELQLEAEVTVMLAELALLLQIVWTGQLYASYLEQCRILSIAMNETITSIEEFVTYFRNHPES